jgi:signal transduction histidine kinase
MLLAIYMLDIRSMITLAAFNLVGLMLVPLMISSITPDMMMGSVAFLSGIALLSVVASWLRKTHMVMIMQQRTTLAEQKSELELYSSIIRHDLKNDLGVILGAADTCMMVEEKDIMEDSIEVIIAASERMLNVLNAFIRTPAEEYHDIITMIESVVKNAEKAHPNLTISMDVDEEARNMSMVPARLLPMVLENLFRNASVYAGETPVITVMVSGDDAGLQIDVSDDGPGIAPTVRDRLFQRGASSRGKGKGLGLYLSKRIIESQGGSLNLLESTTGCTFRVRISSRNH